MSRTKVHSFNLALLAASIDAAVHEVAERPSEDGPVVVVMPLDDPAAYKVVSVGDAPMAAITLRDLDFTSSVDPADLAEELRRQPVIPRDLLPKDTPPRRRAKRPAKPTPPRQPPRQEPSRKPPTRRRRERRS